MKTIKEKTIILLYIMAATIIAALSFLVLWAILWIGYILGFTM